MRHARGMPPGALHAVRRGNVQPDAGKACATTMSRERDNAEGRERRKEQRERHRGRGKRRARTLKWSGEGHGNIASCNGEDRTRGTTQRRLGCQVEDKACCRSLQIQEKAQRSRTLDVPLTPPLTPWVMTRRARPTARPARQEPTRTSRFVAHAYAVPTPARPPLIPPAPRLSSHPLAGFSATRGVQTVQPRLHCKQGKGPPSSGTRVHAPTLRLTVRRAGLADARTDRRAPRGAPRVARGRPPTPSRATASNASLEASAARSRAWNACCAVRARTRPWKRRKPACPASVVRHARSTPSLRLLSPAQSTDPASPPPTRTPSSPVVPASYQARTAPGRAR